MKLERDDLENMQGLSNGSPLVKSIHKNENNDTKEYDKKFTHLSMEILRLNGKLKELDIKMDNLFTKNVQIN